MKAVFKTITPQDAAKLLAKHNAHNRRLREPYVAQLSDEMRGDRWQETHQAIGIGADGDLIDGQHRLAAVVESGKPQRFLVVSGVPREAVAVIDSHSHRRTRDALRLVHGLETTDRAVSCAIYVDSRGELGHYTPAERVEVYLRHKKIVSRAEKIFDTTLPGISRGNIMAVVARALATHTAAKVAPFCRLLVTGESRKRRDAIGVKLRDFLMTKVAGHGSRGSMHVSSYKRTEYALHAWLKGDGGGNLHEAKEELFPLPGEEKRLAAAERLVAQKQVAVDAEIASGRPTGKTNVRAAKGFRQVKNGLRPPLKEAVARVLGTSVMSIPDIHDGLKAKKWLPNSRDTRAIVSQVLANSKDRFERPRRGHYRVKDEARPSAAQAAQ